MLIHNYIYRLKCNIRDKEVMFWALVFPILLATLFFLAFSNISNAENFNGIKIGIVNNTEFQEDTTFREAIKYVSADMDSNNRDLFDVRYTSKEKAVKLLNEGEIEGYIYLDNGIKLFIKDAGINQTIIKNFLDSFKQSSSTFRTLISRNPELVQNGLPSNIFKQQDYIQEVSISKNAPNNIVIYFYALLGMSCLYGSFLGLKEITSLQANLSPQGARVTIAPTHRLRLFTASMLAAITVQLFNILVLLGYLSLILKVDFGNQLFYIVLTCVMGTITGVTFGTSIASLSKKSEGFKVGILITLTMTMAFLSGLMYDGIRYIISKNVPILGYLNPANLITDSLYTLYYYENHLRFFTNITLLGGFTVLFITITYLVLRRQQYASI